jgi:hypothetical protein
LSAFKDKEKLEKAKWISSMCEIAVNILINKIISKFFNTSSHFAEADFSKIIPSLPLIELFQNIMQKTSFGWDQVIQSLVQLGIILMDLAAPSASLGKISGRYIMSLIYENWPY